GRARASDSGWARPRAGGEGRRAGGRARPRRAGRPARAVEPRRLARGRVLRTDRGGRSVTSLIRGELIKTVTTRVLYAYALAAVALAVANVLILTLSEDLRTVAAKQEAIAGLPIMLLLFGLVGSAGEHRHRTAAPAVLAAGQPRERVLVARARAYALPGVAVGR